MRLPPQHDSSMTSISMPHLINLNIPPILHLQNPYPAETHFDGEAPIMPPALLTSWQQATCKHLSHHLRLSFILWHASQSSWFSDPLASWLLSPFSFHVCLLALKLSPLYCSICLFNITRKILLETAFQWSQESST